METRVGKYMVYNPKKDKPVKFFNSYAAALGTALALNYKENRDILVLRVVGNCENEVVKVLDSEYDSIDNKKIIRVKG